MYDKCNIEGKNLDITQWQRFVLCKQIPSKFSITHIQPFYQLWESLTLTADHRSGEVCDPEYSGTLQRQVAVSHQWQEIQGPGVCQEAHL